MAVRAPVEFWAAAELLGAAEAGDGVAGADAAGADKESMPRKRVATPDEAVSLRLPTGAFSMASSTTSLFRLRLVPLTRKAAGRV